MSSHSNNSHNSHVNYSILAVNAEIIGSVFIFFAIEAQVPASTIFALDIKKCSFGFNLLAQHAQIAVVMVGGIIIFVFSVSSVFALIHRTLAATEATSTGFAVMFVAAIIIVLSLGCRLPTDFFIYMMVVPFVIIIMVIIGIHLYSEKRRAKQNLCLNFREIFFYLHISTYETVVLTVSCLMYSRKEDSIPIYELVLILFYNEPFYSSASMIF
jgi:hypothetical protein